MTVCYSASFTTLGYGSVPHHTYAVAVFQLEPCADVILSAAAFRVILTGGGGAPIDFYSASA